MFGKRTGTASTGGLEAVRVTPSAQPAAVTPNLAASQAIRNLEQQDNGVGPGENRRSDEYYQTKASIFVWEGEATSGEPILSVLDAVFSGRLSILK